MALLNVSRVTKRFGGLVAVQAVDLAVEAGSIHSVIGPNGAGKTTFFNMITGIYKPDEGSIDFAGTSLLGLLPEAIAAHGICRTFQNIRLFPELTALENILIGMHVHLRANLLDVLFNSRSMHREEERALAEATRILSYVGLAGRENELAKNLPYGSQRRLEIGRALASQPKLLLLDEPAAGMNPRETADLVAFIRGLRKDLGLTILLIEHDMKLVMGISDRVTVLDHGAKIAEGAPAEVRRHPRVIEAYLGKTAEGGAADGSA